MKHTKNHGQKNSFLFGVALLSASAVLVKLIGVCYKIPLVHLLGTEGMGYFNAAYDVYALLCVISTTGLPVAVSVMMNQHQKRQKAIFRLSLIVFFVLGILGSGLVFLLADPIANAIGAPPAAQSLRTIAPALLFICVASAFRGYCQGKKNMRPTAVSQVIEAVCKLLFGLLLSYFAIRAGLPAHKAAASAVLGLSIATLISTVYLYFAHKKDGIVPDSEPSTTMSLLGELAMIALPVTLSAALTGMSKMLDLGLIMRRLQEVGVSQETAVSLYGAYSAMAIPLFGAVPALFGSLAMPLIPHLTNAIEQKNTHEQSRILSLSFRLTALVSVPSALGMCMLSDRILDLLFGARVQEAELAVPMLILLCMAIPSSCMITTTNAILQSYGKSWLAMASMGLGCMIKAAALYVLTAIPQIGVLAAPMSTWLCCTVVVAVNMAAIMSCAPIKGWVRPWMSALAISAISVGIAAAVKRLWLIHTPLPITVGVPVLCAVVIFVPLAFACRLVSREDIKSLK